MTDLVFRAANRGDIATLARLWCDGWQDAHAQILPDELRRLRTLPSFQQRLAEHLAQVRVAEDKQAIVGLSITKGDELYQFYVAASARGRGVAQALMADTLGVLRASGRPRAWLACAIGNDRAARFYEKTGWCRIGIMTSRLPTPNGVFPLEVWRYEIELTVESRTQPEG